MQYSSSLRETQYGGGGHVGYQYMYLPVFYSANWAYCHETVQQFWQDQFIPAWVVLISVKAKWPPPPSRFSISYFRFSVDWTRHVVTGLCIKFRQDRSLFAPYSHGSGLPESRVFLWIQYGGCRHLGFWFGTSDHVVSIPEDGMFRF